MLQNLPKIPVLHNQAWIKKFLSGRVTEGGPGPPAHKVLTSCFEQHWQPKYVIRFEKQITIILNGKKRIIVSSSGRQNTFWLIEEKK